MNTPYLDDNQQIAIDTDKLVQGKCLVSATTGGGKSYAVRCILERTHHLVQQIVLDRDGEYQTLREKYDYILFGETGDYPVSIPKTDREATDARDTYAGRLAYKLLELGVSAIIDLSGLGGDQDLFVKWFAEALMLAPRDLWRPRLIVIDEAHRYAPEHGRQHKARSTAAVIELATDGRKRGYGLICATQRTAELHNTVIAMLHNRLIGLNILQDDIDRARKQIGMSSKDANRVLPSMEPGTFYVHGPALTRTVERIKIGKVVTTHPEAGQGIVRATPPRTRIQQILGQLGDVTVPRESEVDQLRARVRELENGTAIRESGESPESVALRKQVAELESRERVYDAMHERQCKALDRILDECAVVQSRLREALGQTSDLENSVLELRNSFLDEIEAHLEKEQAPPPERVFPAEYDDDRLKSIATTSLDPAHRLIAGAELGKREETKRAMTRPVRAFLTVLAQFGAKAKGEILQIAQYSSSGPTSTAFADMVKQGWARDAGPGRLEITQEGRAALGDWMPLPTGMKLREMLLDEGNKRLNRPERAILRVACAAYPNQIGKGQLLREAGYASSGPISTAFARLIVMGYLTQPVANHVKAGEILFK